MEKTLIKSDRERDWYLVKEWTTKAGLLARVQQCVWKVETHLLKPHYTGYVQVPSHIKIENTQNLEVHGGVTFGYPQPKELYGAEGVWTGFDMAHYGDEDKQDLGYAINECEELAEQIAVPPQDI